MPSFVVGGFGGPQARTAWAAYLRSPKGFGRDDRAYAAALSQPELIYLCLPAQSTEAHTSPWDPTSVGRAAASVLLVTGAAVRSTRDILYVHTRNHLLGAGCAIRLLEQAKKDTCLERGTLVTRQPACRTWYATLLFLRAGFMASDDIRTCDVPLPSAPITGGSSSLHFFWSHEQLSQPAAAHAEYVTTIRDAQRRRRLVGDRAASRDAFVDALQHVIDFHRRDADVDAR